MSDASSPARLMGLIATSFSGTRCSPARARAAARSPSRFGALQASGTLALVGTDYSAIFLGLETPPGSPGASPVTLPPGGTGWGRNSLARPPAGE